MKCSKLSPHDLQKEDFLHFNAIFISYLPPDLRFPFQKLFIISVTF